KSLGFFLSDQTTNCVVARRLFERFDVDGGASKVRRFLPLPLLHLFSSYFSSCFLFLLFFPSELPSSSPSPGVPECLPDLHVDPPARLLPRTAPLVLRLPRCR